MHLDGSPRLGVGSFGPLSTAFVLATCHGPQCWFPAWTTRFAKGLYLSISMRSTVSCTRSSPVHTGSFGSGWIDCLATCASSSFSNRIASAINPSDPVRPRQPILVLRYAGHRGRELSTNVDEHVAIVRLQSGVQVTVDKVPPLSRSEPVVPSTPLCSSRVSSAGGGWLVRLQQFHVFMVRHLPQTRSFGGRTPLQAPLRFLPLLAPPRKQVAHTFRFMFTFKVTSYVCFHPQ